MDPQTGRVERTFALSGCGPTYAIGEVVWLAAVCEGGTIVRLSTQTNKILREGKLPPHRWYALTPEAFWLSTNPNRVVLLRADPRTLRVVGRIDLGVASNGNRTAIGAGSVWVGGADIVIRVKPHR